VATSTCVTFRMNSRRVFAVQEQDISVHNSEGGVTDRKSRMENIQKISSPKKNGKDCYLIRENYFQPRTPRQPCQPWYYIIVLLHGSVQVNFAERLSVHL
jgi:hypothetical protein